MKHYFFLLSLLLGFTASAQSGRPAPISLPVDPATHHVTYSGIVAVPGTARRDLYARSQAWFAATFSATQRVLLTDDPQAGFLAGRVYSYTNFDYFFGPASQKFWYTIRLSFQEGRYRYLLTDFQYQGGASDQYGSLNLPRYSADYLCLARNLDGTPTRQAAKFSLVLDQHVQRLVASLQTRISQAPGGSTR